MKYINKILCMILIVVSFTPQLISQEQQVANIISYQHTAFTPDVSADYNLNWIESDVDMIFTENYDAVNISGRVFLIDEVINEVIKLNKTYRITEVYEDKSPDCLHMNIITFSGDETGFIRFYKKGRTHIAVYTMDTQNSAIFFRDRQ